MDIYAALNPITTSSYTIIYTGNSTEVGEEYQLGNSKLYTSSSIGDSFQKGLVGEIGYTYDDLGGGFKYDMSYHVNLLNNLDHSLSLNEELEKLSISFDSLVDKKNSYPKNEISIGEAALPVKNFFADKNSLTNLLKFLPSYLDSDKNSLGLGKSISLSNSTIEVGLTMPIDRKDVVKNGSRSNLVGSIEYGDSKKTSISFLVGLSEEHGSLLGSVGENAFSLSGSKAITTFTALKANKNLFDNISITGIASLANTNMTRPKNSLIDSASNLKSSTITLSANVKDLTHDDLLSVYINQPNRVEDGSIAIKSSNLVDSNNRIAQIIKDIDLRPSSRQVNIGLSYRKKMSKDFAFSLKHLITKNLNHNSDSKKLNSSYIGIGFRDLKFGVGTNPYDSSIEKQISYAISL